MSVTWQLIWVILEASLTFIPISNLAPTRESQICPLNETYRIPHFHLALLQSLMLLTACIRIHLYNGPEKALQSSPFLPAFVSLSQHSAGSSLPDGASSVSSFDVSLLIGVYFCNLIFYLPELTQLTFMLMVTLSEMASLGPPHFA